MAKTNAQRVREAEASRRARGEREIRVWVPDTPEAKQQVRDLARRLCAENAVRHNPTRAPQQNGRF